MLKIDYTASIIDQLFKVRSRQPAFLLAHSNSSMSSFTRPMIPKHLHCHGLRRDLT